MFSWLKNLFKKKNKVSVINNVVDLKPVAKPVEQTSEEKKKSPPWYLFALKYKGQNESNTAFNKFVSSFWKIVGLPSYKTIIGTSFAWCGLWIALTLNQTGFEWSKDGASARSWSSYGQAIDWKKNGIPQGAIIHINHNSNCNSGSSNHVTMANGDCTAEDLLKKGATFGALGGNQGNEVKVSVYDVKEICAVRWPPKVALPAKVLKSENCTGKATPNESTR